MKKEEQERRGIKNKPEKCRFLFLRMQPSREILRQSEAVKEVVAQRR